MQTLGHTQSHPASNRTFSSHSAGPLPRGDLAGSAAPDVGAIHTSQRAGKGRGPLNSMTRRVEVPPGGPPDYRPLPGRVDAAPANNKNARPAPSRLGRYRVVGTFTPPTGPPRPRGRG